MKKQRSVLLALSFMSVLCSAAELNVPNTQESINKGRALFQTLCTQCHGHDGKAQIDVVANATDLTDPTAYLHGSDDAAIEKSIRDGAGAIMPAWGTELRNPDDIGHLRNFIQSLWPEDKRPALVE